jgi:hypothetical protein
MFLTEQQFYDNSKKNHCKNWRPEHLGQRWKYHLSAINVLKSKNPKTILEVGSLGALLSDTSDTLDYDGKKNMDVWPVFNNVTYNHDLMSIPWPISDKKYDFFIALRVFHHLAPKQKECFQEAKRISNNILIAIPNAIPLSTVNSWNDGFQPTKIIKSGFATTVYYWSF